MKGIKGVLIAMLILATTLLSVPATVHANEPQPEWEAYETHIAAVGGRRATEDEIEELRSYLSKRKMEIRNEIVLDMFNTVWCRTRTVQRIYEAIKAEAKRDQDYDPCYIGGMFRSYDTKRERIEEDLPKKIWDDAWFLIQNEWGFWVNLDPEPNTFMMPYYRLDDADVFMTVYEHSYYPTPYQAEEYARWNWDIYTFADGREAHMLFNYRSIVHLLDIRKQKVKNANKGRTLLGNVKSGKLELYTNIKSDSQEFWLDLGKGWYYTLEYVYYGTSYTTIIVDPHEYLLPEDIVDEGTSVSEIR